MAEHLIKAEVASMLLAKVSKVSIRKMKSGKMKGEYWPKICQAASKLCESRILIGDRLPPETHSGKVFLNESSKKVGQKIALRAVL